MLTYSHVVSRAPHDRTMPLPATASRRALPTVARWLKICEIDLLDAVQDLRVQRQRRRDARARRRGQHVDARPGAGVYPARRGVLVDQRATHPGVGAPVGLAPAQQLPVDAVGGELVGGQVDPAAAAGPRRHP